MALGTSLSSFLLLFTVCRESSTGDLLLVAGGLLGQENCVDVGQDTSLSDGDSGEKLVQLFVVADGELKMTGVDSRLLVVTGSVASQLKHLSSEVLEDGGKVDGGSSSNTLGIVALAEQTVETSNGELKSCTRRARFGLSARLGLASLSSSRHDDLVVASQSVIERRAKGGSLYASPAF